MATITPVGLDLRIAISRGVYWVNRHCPPISVGAQPHTLRSRADDLEPDTQARANDCIEVRIEA